MKMLLINLITIAEQSCSDEAKQVRLPASWVCSGVGRGCCNSEVTIATENRNCGDISDP